MFPFAYSHLARYMDDPLAFWMKGMREHGDVFRFTIGPQHLLLLAHPDHVRDVLETRRENYLRGGFFEVMKLVVGDCSLTTDGDVWRGRNEIVSRALHQERVNTFGPMITRVTAELLESWRSRARDGRPFDLMADVFRLQLRIMSQVLFSSDVLTQPPLAQAVASLMAYLHYRSVHPAALPLAVPVRRNIQVRRARRTLAQALREMIRVRQRKPGDAGDILSFLLQVPTASGRSLTLDEIHNEIAGILMPGFEPGAVVLAWACYLLSTNPEIEARVEAELRHVLAGRSPTVAAIPRLPCLNRVIEETIRLYPAIWMFIRIAQREDEINGFRIPAKAMIVISPYVTHRHPSVWADPEKFDPDRFLPARGSGRPPHVFSPWGLGAHQCTGRALQLVETPLVLAMILQAYRLRPAAGQPVHAEGRVTIRPRNGMMMMTATEA